MGVAVVEPLTTPINYTGISVDCAQLAPRAETVPVSEQDESIFHTYSLPLNWNGTELTGQKNWATEIYSQIRTNPKALYEWVRLFQVIRKPEDHPDGKITADLIRAIGTRTTDDKFASSVLEVIQRTPDVNAEISRQCKFLSQVDGTEGIVELLEK